LVVCDNTLRSITYSAGENGIPLPAF